MNDPIAKQNQPKKQVSLKNDNILESFRTIGSSVGKSVAKDVTSQIASDALASLFGTAPNQQGELRPNASVDLGRERIPYPGMRRPEIRTREPWVTPVEPQLRDQIEAVRAELKALASSIKLLNNDIRKSITETPVDPGIYHKNFFERLRSILQLMREQIDDSRTWMALSNTRKQKRGYWGMYKKHGTSFGLSNERTMATQAG